MARRTRLEQAVLWREADGVVRTGKLELGDERLTLAGSAPGGGLAAVRIRYDDLASVRIGRSSAERVQGSPALVLERSSGSPVHVAALNGGGTFEAGDLLAGLIAERNAVTARVAVVLPIRKGTSDRARALVEQGPPFDPERLPFERHHVFVSEREVVFLFEGPDVGRAAERLIREPSVWKAAAAWRACLAGPPRLVEEAYGWSRGADS